MKVFRALPVQSSPTTIAAQVEGERRTRRLRFEFSVPASASGDFALPASLFPAMARSASLRIEGPVDPGLLRSQNQIQRRVAAWDRALTRVPVTAPERPAPASRQQGMATFFSGGLDSFYTLLRRSGEITHLIVIHGFDVPLEAQDIRQQISRMAREVARELEAELIEVETDAKQIATAVVHWHWYHGGVLAAVAQALDLLVGRVVIPATLSEGNLTPWGSHPELDPLWSTARVSIEHDGAEASRVQKAELVGDSDLAMRWLRVCWRDPGQWNCGRCEKCLRTMLNLAACGALAGCRTLPDRVDPRAIRALVLRDENDRLHAKVNLERLRTQGDEPELVDALEVAIRRSPYRAARRRLADAPARVAHGVRRRLTRRAPGAW